MAFTRAWINFKRMQDSTVAASVLIYAGATLHAFRVLPGETALKVERTLTWPGLFLVLTLLVPLAAAPLRRGLSRYVWLSFVSGFGQTAVSVLTGIGLLCAAALFIYWQLSAVAHGGRYPAGVFSGYAAGIGILIAQAWLARRLERDPQVRAMIVARET